MKKQRGFVGVGVLIAILVGLAVLGGGAYWWIQQNLPAQTAIEVSNTTDTSNTASQTNTTPNPATTTPKPDATTQPKTNTQVSQSNTLDLSHQYSYRDVMDNVSVLTDAQLKQLVAQISSQPNVVMASILLQAPNLTASQRQTLVDVIVTANDNGNAIEGLQAKGLTQTQTNSLYTIVVNAMKSPNMSFADKVFASPNLSSDQINTLFAMLVDRKGSVDYMSNISDVFSRYAMSLTSTQRQTLLDLIIKDGNGHASILIADALQSNYLTDTQRQTLVDIIVADKDLQGISYVAKKALKAPNLTASQQVSIQTIATSGK